jgi:hypothetical protein
MAEVRVQERAEKIWYELGHDSPPVAVIAKYLAEFEAEIITRAYAESGRQGKINCFCEMPDCPQCSPLPIPSSTNTESGQDEYRRGVEDSAKCVEAAWHNPERDRLAAAIRKLTAERSHAGQEEGQPK